MADVVARKLKANNLLGRPRLDVTRPDEDASSTLMREIGPMTEDEMVLAWVAAEYHSGEYVGQVIRETFQNDTRFIDDRASTDDLAQNLARKFALARARGYGVGNYIFERFPSDAAWMRLELTHEELGELRYMNHEDWVALSGGTRLVSDRAANVGLVAVKEYVTEKVQRIEAGVRGGWPRAPLRQLSREAGPAADADVQISGFNILECADFDEALEVAAKHPVAAFGTLELRAFADS